MRREDVDLPEDVYVAYKAVLGWEPKGKWNQRMRRKALKYMHRFTIYGGRPKE